MDLVVTSDGWLTWPGGRVRCSLGHGGVVAENAKHEGDGATPAGIFPIRRVMYRADRIAKPASALNVTALRPADAWCDDPTDSNYNLPVERPYRGSTESLWREDSLYDVLVVIGHNGAPVRAGLGSAIFFHVAREDYAPTEGCVAVALPDMLQILNQLTADSRVIVRD